MRVWAIGALFESRPGQHVLTGRLLRLEVFNRKIDKSVPCAPIIKYNLLDDLYPSDICYEPYHEKINLDLAARVAMFNKPSN